MIPAPFSYHRPNTVADAAKLLAQHGDDGRVLAGGQSLIPMMKLRLAVPHHLIDLGGIGDLKGVQKNGSTLVVGAMTTQHEVQQSRLATEAVPSAFGLDPAGRFAAAAGTVTGRLAVYRIQGETRALSPLETYAVGQRPAAVLITQVGD